MKDGVPAWSVVAVLFRGPTDVLAINRNFNKRDPSLPGGDSDPDDESPAQTARREVFEETGLLPVELRCMDTWIGERGQTVYAFFIPRWKGSRLRSSDEGKPFWVAPEQLLIKSATYKEEAQRLLEKLGKVKKQP